MTHTLTDHDHAAVSKAAAAVAGPRHKPQQTASNKPLQPKEQLQGVLVKGEKMYLHCILFTHRYDHSATRLQLLNQILQRRNHLECICCCSCVTKYVIITGGSCFARLGDKASVGLQCHRVIWLE